MFERNKAACGYAHMSLVMLNSARDMPAVGASVNGRGQGLPHWPLATAPPQGRSGKHPRTAGGQLLALTLAAKAVRLSAADGKERGGPQCPRLSE